ncbi:hypothetical protein SNEBB_002648 [Seison nebaliae]|nr:hypothetical protein SNEBB_002648 [Seison nebaliae]
MSLQLLGGWGKCVKLTRTNLFSQTTSCPFSLSSYVGLKTKDKDKMSRLSVREILNEDGMKLNKSQTEIPSILTKIDDDLLKQPVRSSLVDFKVNNIAYRQLPIVHVKATRNNTLFTLVDHKGIPLYSISCGCVGFRNAKKGTTVAAQTTAAKLAEILTKRGIVDVRFTIKGVGPGRMTAAKSLATNGVNIISISDRTPDPPPFNLKRPRKQRRL